MIDVSQWRASIGLWNYCQAASSRPASGRHSHSFKAVIDSNSASWSIVFYAFLLNLLLLFLNKHLDDSSTRFTCVTDIQSIVLPGGSSSIYSYFYLLLCLRIILVLSGDVECNPGPITGIILKVWNKIVHFAQNCRRHTGNRVHPQSPLLESVPHDITNNEPHLQEHQYTESRSNDSSTTSPPVVSSSVPATSTTSGNPKDLLQNQSDKLARAISVNLYNVTDALYAKELIPQQTKEEMYVLGLTNNEKSSKLMNVIEQQLESSLNQEQYLIDICHVLICQQHRTLTDITTSILHELGQYIPDSVSIKIPDDVQRYADYMRQHYKHQPTVALDWPPRIGKDFFGRLALLEKQDSSTQAESAWHLLRGQVDETVKLTENKEINVDDVLQPTDSSLSLRVVIDGPPGIGKTTLCHKLLQIWSNGTLQQYDLVLYCPLRNSKIATGTTLADLFVCQRYEVPMVAEWFEKRNGERLLIIFDGWDELSEQLRQSSLAGSIIRREQLDQCSVIVTSHSYASNSIMTNPSRHVHVIGFSKKEISTVIIQTFQEDTKLAQELIDENTEQDEWKKFFGETIKQDEWKLINAKYKSHFTTTQSSKDSQLAVKLINDLKVRNDVQSLCYVPLVCSMVILVYRKEGGHLPKTLTQLYENFILQTIRRHVKKHDINSHTIGSLSSLPSQLAKPLQEMCQLAYTNLANTRMTFSSHQVQSLSEAVKEDYLGLMTTFIEHHEEKYQFLHLSIQEFLAAWWIAKEPNPEGIFDKHFHNDHFRMCLRFVAGLTNLSHVESYEQYFNKPIDLQCKTKRLLGFESWHQSYFYTNPIVGHVHQYHFLTHVDHFPILLLHLLYESQNTTLCQTLALSIRHQSICLYGLEFSLFDVLCLNFFLENVKTTWSHLHLMPLRQDELSVLTNVLITKRLDAHFYGIKNDAILQLINVQECYIIISDASLYTCNVLVQFLKFSQIKILHLKVNENIPEHNMKICCCSSLEECLKDTDLQEFVIDLEQASQFNPDVIEKISVHGKNFLSVIIKGMCKNITITKFSMQFHCVYYHNSLHVPQDLMKKLFNENRTLNALSGNCFSLWPTIEMVKTPLAALDIKNDSYHINGLERISLQKLHPSHVINPSLVVVELMLYTCESAIELFCILKNDVTLKSLRVTLTGDVYSSIWFQSLCINIQEMLQQNKTLECFEIDRSRMPPPYTFYSCLITGLEGNNTLQQLCLPISLTTQFMYSKVDHIKDLFNVLSHKKNLTELQLEFEGHDTRHTIIATTNNTIFQHHVLPLITDVLLLNERIKLLSLNAWVIDELKNENIWKNFFVAILNHPSLQYVAVKMLHSYWRLLEFLKSQIEHDLNTKQIIIGSM